MKITSKKKKFAKYSYFTITICVCVVLFLLALFGRFISRNSPSKVETNPQLVQPTTMPVSPQPLDASDWKTTSYFNINFKIPPSWDTDTTGRDSGPYVIRIFNDPTLNGYMFVVEICENCLLEKSNFNNAEILVNQDGKRYFSRTFRSQPSGGGSRKDYYIESGKDIYHFSMSGSLTNEELNYFDKIFTTFKFTN